MKAGAIVLQGQRVVELKAFRLLDSITPKRLALIVLEPITVDNKMWTEFLVYCFPFKFKISLHCNVFYTTIINTPDFSEKIYIL